MKEGVTMGVISKFDAFNRLAKILDDVDATRAARKAKMDRWEKEKVRPTKQAVVELDRADTIARQTAERSMQLLRKDYESFLRESTLPFTIRAVEKDGVTMHDIMTDVTGMDLRFLEMLDHFKLSPEEVQYYGKNLVEEGKTAMARALKERAEQWGYDTHGLCVDANEELKAFDQACSRVRMICKPINEDSADGWQLMQIEMFRDELRSMVENSQNLPEVEVTVKPKTIEEEIASDLKRQREAEESGKDAFADRLEFTKGFDGDEGVRDLVEVEARAQAKRTSMDNQTNAGESKETEVVDQKDMESRLRSHVSNMYAESAENN